MNLSDYFLSINRFEYKKNLELALNAYAEFRTKLADPSVQVNRILFAGGYDSRLSENEECFFQLHRQELKPNFISLCVCYCDTFSVSAA